MSAAGKNACPTKTGRATRPACGTVGGKPEADHRHKAAGVARKTACSTERPVWQAWRRAPRGGVAVGRKGGRRVRGPRPTGMSAAGKNACPTESRPRKKCVRYSRGGGKSEADHRHKAAGVARKTACSTERPVWHARLRAPRRGRCGKPGGALHGEAGAASVRASSTAGAGRRTALLGDGVSAGYRRWRRKERWF